MKTKVIFDGIEYEIDLAKAKELNLLEEVWKPVKLGDKFLMGSLHEEYILSCPIAEHICLISTDRGFRWSNCVRVSNPATPTKEEFLILVGSNNVPFSRVPK